MNKSQKPSTKKQINYKYQIPIKMFGILNFDIICNLEFTICNFIGITDK